MKKIMDFPEVKLKFAIYLPANFSFLQKKYRVKKVKVL